MVGRSVYSTANLPSLSHLGRREGPSGTQVPKYRLRVRGPMNQLYWGTQGKLRRSEGKKLDIGSTPRLHKDTGETGKIIQLGLGCVEHPCKVIERLGIEESDSRD